MSVRSKTIIAIVGVILIISASYFLFFLNHRDDSRDLVLGCKKQLVSTFVSLMTREFDNRYGLRIKSFNRHQEEIVRLFAERDLAAFRAAMTSVYESLKGELRHLDHIDFVLPDNTVFLTLGEGESCEKLYDFAASPENEASDYVYGTCGLVYRVVQPLFYRDRFAGNVVLSISIESILENIRTNLDMYTALSLSKEFVAEQGRYLPGGAESGNDVVYDFGDPFFRDNGSMLELDGPVRKILHGNTDYIAFPSYTIKDGTGREIGRIIQAVDFSSVAGAYRRDISRMLIITGCILVLASLILYVAFSSLQGELVGLNRQLREKNEALTIAGQRLEEQVQSRTAELEEANEQLVREIEERQKVNISLTQSIKEWQSTFNAIVDPITILDKNLDVVIANKASQELLSRDGREIVGRSCHELFASRFDPCEDCPVGEVFAGGFKAKGEVEHEYLGRTMAVSCMPILDGVDVTGYIHTAKDITTEKVLRKQLAQAQKMEAIATLAGGIAHDFNNILGAILGNADLLLYKMVSPPAGRQLKELTKEDIASHLEAIKKAGNRAKELVGQILTFSRQSKTERQKVLISPVIKEGVKLLRSSLAANIEIVSSIESEPWHIYADLSQIHQVFMNFCTNAAQAMTVKGGVLEIGLRNFTAGASTAKEYPDVPPGRYLALSVKDSGHGMSPEIMERIFDPFFTTRDVSEGTGMGLSVIHGIISSHDGILDVKSEVNKGSVFTVFFPSVEEEAEIVRDPVLGVPRGREKILFVDDEFDIVKLGASMLNYLGYTVFSATSGEKALQMLGNEAADVDLVICDYSMTGMSGSELAAEVIKTRPDLPFILCSGFSEEVVLDDSTKRVIRKFMSKPLDMNKLAVVIREVLS